MNNLLSVLSRKNDLSIDSLKKLYRKLVLQTHPDITKGTSERFVKLQKEYSEALQFIIQNQNDYHKVYIQKDTPDKRTQLLKMLYVYSIRFYSAKFYGKESEFIMKKLIHLANSYDPEVGSTFADYNDKLIDHLPEWANSKIYKVHDLFIISIKELTTLFEIGTKPDRMRLDSYLNELDDKAKALDSIKRDIFWKLGKWIRSESMGKPVAMAEI